MSAAAERIRAGKPDYALTTVKEYCNAVAFSIDPCHRLLELMPKDKAAWGPIERSIDALAREAIQIHKGTQAKFEAAAKQCTELWHALNQAADDYADKTSELDDLFDDNAALKTEIKELEESLEVHKHALNTSRRLIASQESMNTTLEDTLFEHVTRVVDFGQERDQYKTQAEHANKELDALRAELQELQAARAADRAAILGYESEATRHKTEYLRLSRELDDAKSLATFWENRATVKDRDLRIIHEKASAAKRSRREWLEADARVLRLIEAAGGGPDLSLSDTDSD